MATFSQPDVSLMAPAGVDLSGKFTAGKPVTGDQCAFYADVRGEIAIQLLEQLLARQVAPVDVVALAAAIAPQLTAGATADQIAQAVVQHLTLTVGAK